MKKVTSVRNRIRRQIPGHLFFWILSFYILLRIFVHGNEIESIDILFTFLFQITIAPFAYFNLWLKPKIIRPGNWIIYALTSLGIIASGAVFNLFFFNSLIDLILPGYYFISYYNFIDIAQFYFGHLLILTLLQFSLEWFELNRERQRMSEMEKEKVEFEMKALLTQINPHFLFNTLNSLYSMVLNKKDQSGEYILKLADVLRYVIYQSKKSEIPLQEEVQLLKDYILLNQLRQDNPNINFEVDIQEDWSIAPMLLLPLIENAFKHGSADHNRTDVYLSAGSGKFVFTVENGYKKDSDKLEMESKGIGNENIKRRLQILYPDRHKLVIEEKEHTFKATIELWKA